MIRSLLLFTALSLVAYADQITLKNGDRITAAIVKKDGNTLTVKSAVLGALSVPWDQIDSIKSDAPLTIVLKDKTVQALVESVPAADVVGIRNADEQKAYERMLHPGWGQVWAGSGTFGFAGTKGNADTLTLTTAVNASRVTNTDKTTLYFNTIKSSALVNGVHSDTASAVRGGWAYSHNISGRTFLTSFNDYEHDRFQSLDLRFSLGGGVGYTLMKRERGRLDLAGGGDYNHEKFSSALSRTSGEFFWGDDYNFKLTGATALTQTFRMFNNISDVGAYRMNFDLTASTKLHKWLNWNLGLSDRYFSNPVPGRKSNDLVYTTGVGVTFAR